MATLWGEVEEDEYDHSDTEFKLPWHENWQPSSAVVCKVPPLPPPITSPPVPRHILESCMNYPVNGEGGNIVLHNIDLLQYIEEMKQLISQATDNMDISTVDTNTMDTNTIENRDSIMAPLPPTRYWPNMVSLEGPAVWHLPAVKNPEISGSLPTVISIDRDTRHSLLKKSVAAMCLHSGYHDAVDNTVTTLAIVLEHFLTRTSVLLAKNTDSVLKQDGGVHIAIEKTLLQQGFGGVAGIGKYWQELVDYHNSLTHTAEEQREMWKKIMTGPVVDRNILIQRLKLPLKHGRDTTDVQFVSPWIANTPIASVDEDTSQLNIQDTPDTPGALVFPEVQDADILGLASDLTSSRKRQKYNSFGYE